MNQSTLAKLSPLSQSAISNIANWKYTNILSQEKCRDFGTWYKQHITEQKGFPKEGETLPRDSRLTFHPKHEIPLLRNWYNANKTPSDKKLNFYAAELNTGHVRQERPKVTIAKLKIWWKNERQREKRLRSKCSETETTPEGSNDTPDNTEPGDVVCSSGNVHSHPAPVEGQIERGFQTLQPVSLMRSPRVSQGNMGQQRSIIHNLQTGSPLSSQQSNYHQNISPASRESDMDASEKAVISAAFSRSPPVSPPMATIQFLNPGTLHQPQGFDLRLDGDRSMHGGRSGDKSPGATRQRLDFSASSLASSSSTVPVSSSSSGLATTSASQQQGDYHYQWS